MTFYENVEIYIENITDTFFLRKNDISRKVDTYIEHNTDIITLRKK